MHCLVVDPNVAFATLLKEELMRLGHNVDVCTSGANAMALVSSSPPDLALLDMGLEGPDALVLGRRLRELRQDIRLVLIPLMGEQPALGEDAPAIQGVLPKPFFLPELPDRIASALAAPLDQTDPEMRSVAADMSTAHAASSSVDDRAPAELGSHEAADVEVVRGLGGDPAHLAALLFEDTGEASKLLGDDGDGGLDWLAALEPLEAGAGSEAGAAARPPVLDPGNGVGSRGGQAQREAVVSKESEASPVFSRRAFRMNQGRIEALMRELVAEVGADGVILTCDTGLLTAVGGLDENEIESISAAVLSGSRTSAEMARIMGREQLRFEQSIAGGSYLLYALGIQDAILAVTVSGDAPLGLLRHQSRAAAERISDLCT